MLRLTIKKELRQLNLKNPLHLIAVGFGSGFSPWMPGTIGTIAAMPFYLVLSHFNLLFYFIIIAIGFALGVYACQQAKDAIGVEDHGGIVWDEFIGFFITMIAAPSGWQWILLGFALFRFFDILKPYPISWCDKHVKGGLGIMLDDAIAGLMALAVLQIIARF